MPTPVSGLIRVTLSGTYLGNSWANVYHYWNEDSGPVTEKILLANDFNSKVANPLATMMSNLVDIDLIKIEDVLGITNDWAQPPSNTSGNKPGDCLARFTAFQYLYSVSNKETRKGHKRYVGVVEGDTDQGLLNSAALLERQSHEATFFASLVNSTQTYRPVVYGGPTLSNPTRSVVNLVNGVTALQGLTTQNSRK